MNAGTHRLPAPPQGLTLGRVVDVQEPQGRGRVQVRLASIDLAVWASVATASAGRGYGIQLLPRADEVVVVAFLSPEQPVVLGSIWTGDSAVPEQLDRIADRYGTVTPAGMAMVLDDAEGPRLRVTTPTGHQLTLTDGEGGKLAIELSTTTIEVTPTEVTVSAAANVTIEAAGQIELRGATVKISAGSVTIDSGVVNCSGVVNSTTSIASSVVGTTYTPGAGNVW
jgi:uncharacterized protein involved in type VI secretion and phage assembly